MPGEGTAAEPALPEGRFDGREAFDGIVRAALSSAARQGWRELVFSDPDFADWPLGERDSIEALQAWSASGRRFILLAQRFDVVERTHARFVPWRRMWDHIVECRATAQRPATECRAPSGRRSGSRIESTPSAAAACAASTRVRAASCAKPSTSRWRAGRPAFPASTLGL
jgi:hypothetical protein